MITCNHDPSVKQNCLAKELLNLPKIVKSPLGKLLTPSHLWRISGILPEKWHCSPSVCISGLRRCGTGLVWHLRMFHGCFMGTWLQHEKKVEIFMQRLIYSIFSLPIGNFDLSTQLSWAVVLEAEDFFSFPAVQKAAVAHKATGAQVLATEMVQFSSMLRLARGISFELVFCTQCQISWRWMYVYMYVCIHCLSILWSFQFLCTLPVVAVPWWNNLNSICGRSCCIGLCRRAAPMLQQRHKNGSFSISKSKGNLFR